MKRISRTNRRNKSLRLESLEPRTLLAADIVMFNDLTPGPGTSANVTSFAANGIASGTLLNAETGDETDLTLTTFESGVTFQTNGANPSNGTDAYEVFDGFVDFSSGSGSSLEIAGDDSYTYEFSGLDDGKAYEFVGTAIRGNANYLNRWTLVSIEGAESFTADHSAGVGIVTDGLPENQVAILVGANQQTDQGFVAQWLDIDPGADGIFSVESRQYTGPTPGVGSGIANGSKGYGIAGIRLIERDVSLRVSESIPSNGEVVATTPSVVVTDFNQPINTATLQANDLTINGQAAVGVVPIGDDAARWTLPGLSPGVQTIEIAEGAIDAATAGDTIREFSATFTIAEAPTLTNTMPTAVLANSASVGGEITNSGGLTPSVNIYWGTSDGGTNAAAWHNVVELGLVDFTDAGTVITALNGLSQDTDYFYRAFAQNEAGSQWAPSTSQFTTTRVSLPSLILEPASDVGAFSASIAGVITDPGGDAPEVSIYYGERDGGTVAAEWDNVLVVGERIDLFADSLTGLNPETQYFFRAVAENSAGTIWSANTLSFTTIDSPSLLISEFMASNVRTLSTRTRDSVGDAFGPVEFPDWIEIQNQSAATVELGGMHLTDDLGDPNKWQFPVGTTLPANGFLVIYASARDITNPSLDQTGRLHTSFSLSASGESIALTAVDGTIIDSMTGVPGQAQDISFGLVGNAIQYMASPTPGASNSSNVTEFVADTQFSVDRGFYDEPFTVEITSDTPEATIRYTLDGTAPSATRGTLYTSAIRIDKTTTLRAIAYQPGLQSTDVDTQTYIFVDDVIQQTSQSTIANGFPSTWGGQSPDYGMDRDVIGPKDDFDGRYAATIREDLKSLPTLSIVTDINGIFGPSGIYSNPGNSSLEVPTSVEFFSEDGSEEFQIDAGVKIQGGAFRSFGLTRKKSLRLKFKSEYGAAKLNYPIFGDDAAQEFDTLTLRMEANDGWQWGAANGQPQYARDEFGRRTQLAMGQPASHGRHTHVYINGVYWGMYNMVERPDQSFGESYLGSDKDDWDGLNSGSAINADNSSRANRATSAWNTLVSLSRAVSNANTEQSKTAALLRAQGLNEDGTNDPSRESYVDIENMIDYFIVNWYAGNSDWPQKNYYVGRENSPDSEGFQFFMWDAEWSLFLRSNLNTNRINDNRGVAGPIQNFRASEEFRIQFADRVQKHLVNPGGVLYVNPENPTYDPARAEDNVPASRYASIAEEIFSGLVAESARWGDQHRSTPYTRDAAWQNEYDNILTGWFPERTAVFLNQLKAADLYPEIAAPTFELNGQSSHGGTAATGDQLRLVSALGEISRDTVLMTQGHPMQAFVPMDGSLETGPGARWYDESFVPIGWINGTNGVGYADGSPGDAYDPLIGTDIRDQWNAEESSAYARMEFDLDVGFDPDDFDRMTLRMKYDDGFIAYLNGQQIRSVQAPANANWQSNATGSNSDGNAIVFEDFNVTAHKDLLKPGKNVIAIHVLNTSDSSSDMLGLAELVVSTVESVDSAPIYYTIDGTDPRDLGGAIQGMLLTGEVPLTGTTTIRARALAGDEWSALNEATFVINPASAGDLVISEINYNPASPTLAELSIDGELDNDDFEFVEVMNRSDQPIDLFGLRFERGAEFEFPSFSLASNERAVIVQDAEAFHLRYGDSAKVIGELSEGALSNGGERLTIVAANGETIADLSYSDGPLWPQAADGVGATLELISPSTANAATFNKYYAWRSSTESLGTPGTDGMGPLGVRISEVLAHTDPPLTDADSIELHNTTDQAIEIGGWYLSDSATNLLKFQIPTGTVLEAGAYVVFDESDFNATPQSPTSNDFALSGAKGDDVWLVDSTEDTLRFIDDVHFDATLNGQTLGVTDQSNGRLVPLTRNGLGCGNAQPLVGDAYIETINYFPAPPSAAALAIDSDLDNNDLEYLVVRGPVTDGWRIRGGIDFDFPVGYSSSATTWILSFDPEAADNAGKLAAFKSQYGLSDVSPNLIGGYSGSLDNDGEQLRLQKPDEPPIEDPSFVPYVTVDEVIYDTQGDWPVGNGEPIVRQQSTYFGSSGTSWRRSSDPPMNADEDFNGDGSVDAVDLDLLISAVNRGSVNTAYSLSNSSVPPTANEIEYFVQQVLGSFNGDANLDRSVDAQDLNRVGLNWQSQVCGGWSDGDFNGDGIVDATDLNRIGLNWQRSAATTASRIPRAALDASQYIDRATSEVETNSQQSSRDYAAETPAAFAEIGSRRRGRVLQLGRRRALTKSAESELESVDQVFAELLDF